MHVLFATMRGAGCVPSEEEAEAEAEAEGWWPASPSVEAGTEQPSLAAIWFVWFTAGPSSSEYRPPDSETALWKRWLEAGATYLPRSKGGGEEQERRSFQRIKGSGCSIRAGQERKKTGMRV
jgi:hypothetical protein